ncbi:hypothetical protein O3M35_009476 [Rhynocoris fuscipes]|uniref:Uncharacterized protein n=1 Tax=Rhynocoris fuscipes TaxID=488301 RepID=A0AAW1D3V3_9HEMI
MFYNRQLPNVYGASHSLNLNNQVQSDVIGTSEELLHNRMLERSKRYTAAGAGILHGTGAGNVQSSFLLDQDRLAGEMNAAGGYKAGGEGIVQANLLGVQMDARGLAVATQSGSMTAHGQIKGLDTGFNADIAHEGYLGANAVAGASVDGLQFAGGSANLDAGYERNVNIKGGVGEVGLIGAKLTSNTEGRFVTHGGGEAGFGYFGVGGEFEGGGRGKEHSQYGIGVGMDSRGLNVFGGGNTVVKGGAVIKGTGGIGGAEYKKTEYWNTPT